MGKYSDILITSDFDRTLTGTDGKIPQANLDAIEEFMAQGGAFTVNTGRSLTLARLFLDRVPVNAPVLLYNGAAAYDKATGEFSQLKPIPMEQGKLLRELMALYPDVIVEVQAHTGHYTFSPQPEWAAIYESMGADYGYKTPDSDMGPFLKASLLGPFTDLTIGGLFEGNQKLIERYDAIEADLNAHFGGKLSILRATPVIIDLQAAGVDKGVAARELAERMGRKTLVCIGDERNDLAMLNAADLPFCPADGAVASLYPNAAPCNQGTVADVIRNRL